MSVCCLFFLAPPPRKKIENNLQSSLQQYYYKMTKQSTKIAKCVGFIALHTDYRKLWEQHTETAINGIVKFQRLVRKCITPITIQFVDGESLVCDKYSYYSIKNAIIKHTGKKTFDLYTGDAILKRTDKLSNINTLSCIFNLDVCRCCDKIGPTNDDCDECVECEQYKLYAFFTPEEGGHAWWINHMDKDFTSDDPDAQIDFRAKIINDNYFSVIEWYYYDCEKPIKYYRNTFHNNSVFWQEFFDTYCNRNDDDDDY